MSRRIGGWRDSGRGSPRVCLEGAAKSSVGDNSSSGHVTTTKLGTHLAPSRDVDLQKNGAKISSGERSAVQNASGPIAGLSFKMQQRNSDTRRPSTGCDVTLKTAFTRRLVRELRASQVSASQRPIRWRRDNVTSVPLIVGSARLRCHSFATETSRVTVRFARVEKRLSKSSACCWQRHCHVTATQLQQRLRSAPIDDIKVTSIEHRTHVTSMHAHAKFPGQALKTKRLFDAVSIFDWVGLGWEKGFGIGLGLELEMWIAHSLHKRYICHS